MNTSRENLEFSLSQFADGTLGEMDRRVIEDLLRVDAEARLTVSRDARLTNLLRESMPLPAVDFDRLAADLSAAIDGEPSHVASSIKLSMPWVRRLSIAAAVGIAATVGWHVLPQPTPIDQPPMKALVKGPAIEVATSPGSVRIAVGPSAAMAERGMVLSMNDESLYAYPPRVVITAADAPVASNDAVPLY